MDKGIYNIYTHQSIFQKLFDLSTIDITKLSVDEIKIKIFLSLDKAKLRTDDFDEESFDRGDFYITDSDVAREVFSKIKELHGEHFLNKKKSLVLSILSKLDKEKANYSEIIHSFILVNLSEFFTFKELLDKIFAASNYSTTKFFRFMEEKYRYDDYKTTKDISFIEMLKKGIESKIANDKLTPVKKSVLIAGLRMLGNIHKEFEKREPK